MCVGLYTCPGERTVSCSLIFSPIDHLGCPLCPGMINDESGLYFGPGERWLSKSKGSSNLVRPMSIHSGCLMCAMSSRRGCRLGLERLTTLAELGRLRCAFFLVFGCLDFCLIRAVAERGLSRITADRVRSSSMLRTQSLQFSVITIA